MPDQNNDADAKLKKLGERLRQSEVVPPSDPEARREFLNFIRHEWPKDKQPDEKPAPDASKDQERKPRDPEPER